LKLIAGEGGAGQEILTDMSVQHVDERQGETLMQSAFAMMVNSFWRWLDNDNGNDNPGLAESTARPVRPSVALCAGVADPEPSPWATLPSAAQILVEAIRLEETASLLGDSRQNDETVAGAKAVIEAILDDHCGIPARRFPWPWPAGPPWGWSLVSRLSPAMGAATWPAP
jgi:hypothetical protein